MSEIAINVDYILEMLGNGKTRADVRAYYDLTAKQLTEVFKHEKLKGKRTTQSKGFYFENESDTIDNLQGSGYVEENTEKVEENTEEEVVGSNRLY